ncbi:hypothetical protein WN944_016049 [Citrus x changshan-huyou]|uniref:AARP2CN domain-containing protein n=1 Tax=Citrus x changshan-huyou TaxID=2935761 RepID=A0AAP0MF31_9ROSI
MQNHGLPRVMGVLTHLDKFKDVKKLRKKKQRIKHHFWTEIYDGAKLFYLSGLIHGKYSKHEIHNLARFVSVMKFPPLSWRTSHPYVLVDRFEDVTPPERVLMNNKHDRNVTIYGYLRGCNPKKGIKKGLHDKEKLFYAPISGLGDRLYDKNAVYININDHLVQFLKRMMKIENNPQRKAIFGNAVNHGDPKDSDEEDEDDEHDDHDEDSVDYQLSSGSEEGEDDDFFLCGIFFSASQLALIFALVYGKSTSLVTSSKEVQDCSEGEETDDDEFFKSKGEGNKKLREGMDSGNINMDECSKFKSYEDLKNWKEKEVYESIRDRFVTGDWLKAARRNQVSKANSEDDDSDHAVYGDFEDLETGEKHEGHRLDNSGS